MPAFFIDRPVFAWVVALLICLGGLLAIPFLAVAQYPIVAPPSISVSTSYPGASPENLYNSFTRLIEEELNGANGILNFEFDERFLGQVEITANFVPGTDSESASIEVQNRIKRVEARLPRAVIQQGILIEEASSAVLQIITLRSTDGTLDEVGLGDFLVRNILGEICRIPGVGRATLYSTERALRIWIDPSRLVGYNLTADDVTKAVSSQNAQVASGSIGVEPSNPRQQISAMVLVKGQFASPDEFGAIVLRSNIDGSAVRLRDVARIEVGGLSYQFTTKEFSKFANRRRDLQCSLPPSANALATATAVKARMEALSLRSSFRPTSSTTSPTISRRWSSLRSRRFWSRWPKPWCWCLSRSRFPPWHLPRRAPSPWSGRSRRASRSASSASATRRTASTAHALVTGSSPSSTDSPR